MDRDGQGGRYGSFKMKVVNFYGSSFPVIIVNGNIPLETTLETEKQLTNPLENALSSIPEVELMSSTYPG